MADPRFYENNGPLFPDRLAGEIGATLDGSGTTATLLDLAAIDDARAGDLCFATMAKALDRLSGRTVGAVLTKPDLKSSVPSGTTVFTHADPLAAFAKAAMHFYPTAGASGLERQRAAIHETARLSADVVLEPGVVIGPGVDIGAGTRIGANSVIGRGVAIGRDCRIGPNASLLFTLMGDRVIVHGGVRLGSDGFGFASGPAGHAKIPQLGRVIVQDDVEIGANSTIDRGALGDTVIGEGAKIDNLVQIGHNCMIGRRAIIVSQVGLSGSVTVGDWAVLGGKVGVADHVRIGEGARVAARSGVTRSLDGGKDYAGFPAGPANLWRREVAVLRGLARGDRRRDE